MTKVMKKLACVLMAIMMVAVMMPAMAFAAEGGASTQTDLKVFVNGVDTGKTVSAAYLLNEKNWEEPQIFTKIAAGKKGTSFSYLVAQGPSLKSVLIKAGVIKKNFTEIKAGSLEWWETEEAKATPNGYALAISDLIAATGVVQTDQDINEDNVTLSKVAGSLPVTPVYAVKVKEAKTFEEANEYLNNFSDADACSYAVIGNNLKGDMVVKTNGVANMANANVNGKYKVEDPAVMNIVTAPVKPTNLKVTKSGKTAKVSWKKVKNVAKYQVAYKKASAKKWTVVDTTKTSLKISKLTKGKTYSFKVRAVRNDCQGRNIVGSYTSVKKK